MSSPERDSADPSDDPWLAALGEVAREDAEEAAAPLPESGPLRPLDEGERADLLAAVMARRGGTPALEPSTPLADVAAPSPPRRWGVVAVAGLALAAALAVFVLRPTTAGLPPYALEATGGAQAVRGVDAPSGPVTVYAPGTRFRIVLRPAEAPPGPVEAAVELRGDAGVVPWDPALEVGAGGGVKAEGVFAGPLALPPGDYTATFTVRPAGSADGRQQVEHRFRIESP